MYDRRKMFKFPLNGGGVKAELLGMTDETDAACVTLKLGGFDRPKCVLAHGHYINLYVETHDTGAYPRDDIMHDRYFYIVPTGVLIPEGAFDYIGTCSTDNGLVWHIFEGEKP